MALAAALQVSPDAAAACAGSPLVAGWGLATFQEALAAPGAYRGARDRWTALLASMELGARWFKAVLPPRGGCVGPGALGRWGSAGDGGKYLCRAPQLLGAARDGGCTILSLGSDGNFGFEESLLTVTSCGVHTYDCTYTKPLPPLDARIRFHQVCIGDAPDGTPEGVRYAPLPVLVAELGVPRVDLLKM